MKEIYATSYWTSYGIGLLLWQKGLLAGHLLPGEAAPHAVVAAKPTTGAATGVRQDLTDLVESYFAGAAIAFEPDALPLSFDGMTSFTRKVIRTLTAMPYGKLTSYASLAEAAGYPGAARAVGNVMAANQLPVIIPCHRVIRSDGSLGGFSRGLPWKRRLHAIEGIKPGAR